ncbi:MAG TPA: arsenic resistance N-acetyltransferase ArsN2 [Gemmatimonadaceae bacterium]|nr:arsenic resistance N-acetyltransferase ArsN2 [Gemmatimonadaceae bacterium]
MIIRAAQAADIEPVQTLLSSNDLPLDGVSDNFHEFIVADDAGQIAGAIGLERFGSAALLRSAVVTPDQRGSGIGAKLVHDLLHRARETGVSEIYLLTTTAENYFPRFGFKRTTRDAVPQAVKQSPEFRGACPDSAIVMARQLDTES